MIWLWWWQFLRLRRSILGRGSGMWRAARPQMAVETNLWSAWPVAVMAWVDTACWVLSRWILSASPLLLHILTSGVLKTLHGSVGTRSPAVSFSRMLFPGCATDCKLTDLTVWTWYMDKMKMVFFWLLVKILSLVQSSQIFCFALGHYTMDPIFLMVWTHLNGSSVN